MLLGGSKCWRTVGTQQHPTFYPHVLSSKLHANLPQEYLKSINKCTRPESRTTPAGLSKKYSLKFAFSMGLTIVTWISFPDFCFLWCKTVAHFFLKDEQNLPHFNRSPSISTFVPFLYTPLFLVKDVSNGCSRGCSSSGQVCPRHGTEDSNCGP